MKLQDLCSCHPTLDLEQDQDERTGKVTQTATLEQEISDRLSVNVNATRGDDGERAVGVGITVRFGGTGAKHHR